MTRGRREGGRRLRLRTVLLVGMLVPAVGAGALASATLAAHWQAREASLRLASAAEDVGDTIDAVARVTDEQAHTSVLALASAFDLPEPQGTQESLARARAQVDDLRDSEWWDRMAPALASLGTLRREFDAGNLDFAELSQSFLAISDGLVGVWSEAMDGVDAAADAGDQPAWLRAELRTLRESVEALMPATLRVRASLHVDLGDRSQEVVTELLRANARFAEASKRVDPLPGTRADAAWAALRDDPAARRLELHLARSERVAFGTEPSPYATDMTPLVPVLDDGVRWADLLGATVHAAAIDLERAAGSQADRDGRAVAAWAVGAALVTFSAAAVAAMVARRLVVPVVDLAMAARQVAAGEFAVEPVRPRGAQELMETVEAFNDMAATLAAVEASAEALAGYPDASQPPALPGRTGRALQEAVDRLEASVREIRRQQADLAVLASHDELTGLLNRRAALDSIERDLARVRRDGRSLALLYVDLDGLKRLNDRFGHAVGDAALEATADALGASVRDGDVVARLSGDEFVVTTIVGGGDERTVDALAERLIGAVGRATVETTEGPQPLGCSIGIVAADGTESAEELLGRADTALYAAKGAGRGCAAWAAPHP